MMVDVTAFAEDSFNAKRWINDACVAKPADDNIEKYLAELELRMHLASEDVDAALEIDSGRALQRIPAAVEEVTHVQGDVLSLKTDVGRGLSSISGAAAAAGSNVALLVQLERVKSRMEAACSTLKEATELSAQFARVEGVFAEGDVHRISAALAGIRRGLALVGDVPEFRGGPETLQALEERFQAMVEPAFGRALAARQAEQTAALAALLADSGRGASVQAQYLAARLPTLQGLWDRFEGRGFAAWLPTFYAGVSSAVVSEARWCSDALPDLHPGLVLALLAAFFARIDKPFRTRLASALVQGAPDKGGSSGGGVISVLGDMLAAAAAFVAGLVESLAREGVPDLSDLPAAAYLPFQAQLDRYGELESVAFAADLAAAAADAAPLAGAGADAVPAALAAAGAAVQGALNRALVRCEATTGLAGLRELRDVAEEELAAFLARFQDVLVELRSRHLPGAGAKSGALLEDGGAAVLQLLGASRALCGWAGACQAAFRGAVAKLGTLIEAARGATGSLDPIVLRLQASDGRLARELEAFLAEASQEGYVPLPDLAARALSFQSDTNTLVYDTLMQKVGDALGGLAELPVWAAQEGPTAAGGTLPSFSAYPQQNVTAAGEYLMMLPATLEGLLGAGDEAAEAQVDAEWLDRVAAGAADMYVHELTGIRALSASGAAQLAADLDYFCNVLGALGVALPLQLATWQLAMGWDAAGFADAAAAALADDGGDRDTLEQVAAARGLSMPP